MNLNQIQALHICLVAVNYTDFVLNSQIAQCTNFFPSLRAPLSPLLTRISSLQDLKRPLRMFAQILGTFAGLLQDLCRILQDSRRCREDFVKTLMISEVFSLGKLF